MLGAMRATNRSKVARFAQVVDAIPAAPFGALLYWCHWVLCCCAEPKHTQQEAAHSEQAAGRSIVWCLPRGGPWDCSATRRALHNLTRELCQHACMCVASWQVRAAAAVILCPLHSLHSLQTRTSPSRRSSQRERSSYVYRLAYTHMTLTVRIPSAPSQS